MNVDLATALTRARAVVNGILLAIPSLAIGLLVFAAFVLLGLGVKLAVARVTQARLHTHRNAGAAVGRLAQGLVIFVGLLVALSVALPSFQPGDVVQVLGISSVAIGFAFRDILQNFLAGVLLLITQPFRIGDQIVAKGHEGTVEDIQTRATFIRTYDGRRVVIPNADLFTDTVVVNTAFAHRRLEYDIGIGYGDDVEQARALILEAVQSVDGVLSDPGPDVLLMDLAGSSVNLRARWWIAPPQRADALDARDQVLSAVKVALTAAGIDLPFPTQQLLFHDQTERTDGDRARQREGWPAGSDPVPGPRRSTDVTAGSGAPDRTSRTADHR
ncbi:MAG: mechanosensitive ion channel family protein [Vicinamibacterales bacterium]